MEKSQAFCDVMRLSLVADLFEFLGHAGGIDTQVARLKKGLEKRGIHVSINAGLANADVIHVHNIGPASFSAIRKKNKPIVATMHLSPEVLIDSDQIGKGLKQSLIEKGMWAYARKFYNSCDAVITPTPHVAQLARKHGVKIDYVLSNGVDLNTFKKVSTFEKDFRKKFSVSGKYFLSTGQIIKRKDIDTIIQLAKKTNLQFIHVGFKPMYYSQLYSNLIVKKAPKNLRFLGFVSKEDLIGAYSGAAAFVHPAKAETEGLVLLEAMACKVPVIARNLPVYSGWIKNEHNAILCNNFEEFLEALKAIDNKKLRSKIVKNAYYTAKSKSFDKTLDKHVQIYKKVISEIKLC